MTNKKLYLYIDKEQLKDGIVCIHCKQEFPLGDYEKLYNGGVVEVCQTLDSIPAYGILDNGILREMSMQERWNARKELNDSNYYVKNDIVKEKPTCPENTFVNPLFDENLEKWVEGATHEQVEKYNYDKKTEFYNSELEIATTLSKEANFGMIENWEVEYENIKLYLESIRPNSKAVPKERPEIMNRG